MQTVIPHRREGADAAAPSPASPSAHAQPTLLDRDCWRDALLFWLAQRALFALLTYAGYLLFYADGRAAAQSGGVGGLLLHIWSNWDGAIYAGIASGGYVHFWQAAFFPLYPLLERLGAPLTGGSAAASGVLLANLAALPAFALLRVLVERELGRDTARRALLYLVLFPASFFLAAAYAESLFLLLSVGAFLALRGGHWRTAGALAALATLTRPVGILLLAPLVAEYLTREWRASREAGIPLWQRVWAGVATLALPVALPIGALAVFNLALYPRFGTLVASSAAQATIWRRALSWPWDGLTQAGWAVLHDSPAHAVHAALDFGFTLLLVALALATVRRLPLPYALYTVATAALVLLTPMHLYAWAALGSNVRFLVVVFPAFMLLARWGERRWVHLLVVTSSLLLLLWLLFTFIAGSFVA